VHTSNDAISITDASVESLEATLGSLKDELIAFNAFKYHISAIGSRTFEFGRVPKAARETAENESKSP
jgi:hypothetical protein